MMNYKHWLLLTIVILALIVIFKPVFYKTTNQKIQHYFEEVDVSKNVKGKVIINTKALEKNISLSAKPLLYSTKTRVKPPQQPIPSVELKTGKALTRPKKVYVLEVASFDKADKADAVVAKLRKQGFRSYSKEEEGIHKVFVGPVLGKDMLNKTNENIAKQTGYQAIVKLYLPLKDMP